MKVFYSSSVEQTEQFALKFAQKLKSGDVVAFTGGLGMGKTAFVRGALQAFGDCDVSSPTFAIVNHYRCTPDIYHFDMYRVKGEDDLYSTGFYDYLDAGGILFIEWSENIRELLPDDTIYVHIEPWDDGGRKITVEGDERFDHIGH